MIGHISQLGYAKKLIVSSFDATSGFFQILVHPENWPVLAFKQVSGSVTFRRCPQGLAASGYIYSKMDIILADLFLVFTTFEQILVHPEN